MSDDQRKPWVLPVFFGLLIALFWLVTDLMKPPAAAKATAPVVEDAAGTTPTAVSGTVEVTGTAP